MGRHDEVPRQRLRASPKIEQYYGILELEPGASRKMVKQAYRDLSIVWQPERFADNPRLQHKAREKLKAINEAYHELRSFLRATVIDQSATSYKTHSEPPRESAPPSDNLPAHFPRNSEAPQSTQLQEEPLSYRLLPSPDTPTPGRSIAIGLGVITALVVFLLIFTQVDALSKKTVRKAKKKLALMSLQSSPKKTTIDIDTLLQMMAQVSQHTPEYELELPSLFADQPREQTTALETGQAKEW